MTTLRTAIRTRRAVAVLSAVAALLASCGADGDRLVDATLATGEPSAATVTGAAEPAVVAEPAVEAKPAVAVAPRQVVLAQPAMWPAPEVVFATPEEAAADFVSEVLGVDPVLGEFQRGDSLSGEIEVFSPGDSGTQRVLRGVLFLRQIEPTDGWYVIGAASDGVTITSPSTLAEVPAGRLVVSGKGRGFESTLNVLAFAAGDADARLDVEIASGGALGQLEPYSATLDLSAASPGAVVVVLVRGDTGLDTDPGEFAAIPIVIVERLPELR